jgi:hypothetical protein
MQFYDTQKEGDISPYRYISYELELAMIGLLLAFK